MSGGRTAHAPHSTRIQLSPKQALNEASKRGGALLTFDKAREKPVLSLFSEEANERVGLTQRIQSALRPLVAS